MAIPFEFGRTIWLSDELSIHSSNHGQNMLVGDLINQASKQRDVSKLKPRLPPHLAIMALQIPISCMGVPDKFLWPFTKDGCYSVKSGYHYAKQINKKILDNPSISPGINPTIWRILWNLPCPQKIKHFLWRIFHNAVPV